MMEQMSLFDFIEDGEKYKPIRSTDWKWKFSDYPEERTESKCSLASLAVEVVRWATS